MAGALVMVASAALAQAAAIRDCPPPPGAVNVALPYGLPPVLRKAMGNIALPGEPFNAIDIYVTGQPNFRAMPTIRRVESVNTAPLPRIDAP